MTTTEVSKRPQRQSRRSLFDRTGDPVRIAWVVAEARKLGRTDKEIHDFIRSCLRVAREQGRREAAGRR